MLLAKKYFKQVILQDNEVSDRVIQKMFFSQYYILYHQWSLWCSWLCLMSMLMFVRGAARADGRTDGRGAGDALIQEAKCQGALSPWDASQSHLTAAAEEAHTCITHPFRVTLQCIYRVGPQKNFQPEQIFNSWGCLWLTRVPGPAPGVRFQLSLPMRTGKLQRGLYAFFFSFFFNMLLLLLLQSYTCIT